MITLLEKVTEADEPPQPATPEAERATRDAREVVDTWPDSELSSEAADERMSHPAIPLPEAVKLETQRAEREATVQATERRTAHLLRSYPGLMPANPRLIKRVANTWGMLLTVQRHLHVGHLIDAPSKELVVRAAIMFVRFPALVDELLSGAAPPATGSPSPWSRPDVQRLLTADDGSRIPPAEIARCYGRQFQ